MIKINNLTKKYGDKVILENVSSKFNSGMNFIVGPSGSGKTTLLRMIAAIDRDYQGDIYLNNKNIKDFTATELSYSFNSVVAMISQDFNIIQSKTVLENVLLPTYLKQEINKKMAEKLIKSFNLQGQIDKKVKDLSGGEKQRVAIIREFMKNPSVILADEPSSALDSKTRDIIMKNLRHIAKTRTVIMITHDRTLINPNENIYEIVDKKIIGDNIKNKESNKNIDWNKYFGLSFTNTIKLSLVNLKESTVKTLSSMFIILLSSILLFTGISAQTSKGVDNPFKALTDIYGDQLLDIGIVDAFSDAVSTGEQEDKPNADVKQNIKGLYEKYAADERVELVTYQQPFDNINIELEDKNYNVDFSGSMPAIGKLVSGEWPSKIGVIVPLSWVKQSSYTKDTILNKDIVFNANVKGKDVTIRTIITGVMDTNQKSEVEGEIFEYSIDDSFFFGYDDLSQLVDQAQLSMGSIPFYIRPKTPQSMLEIRDELFADGIIPMGRFEIVEDINKISGVGENQSEAMNKAFTILGIGITGFSFAIISFLRRKDYSIYKLSGYTLSMLFKLTLAEQLILTAPTFILATVLYGTGGIISGVTIFVLSFIVTIPFILTARLNNLFEAGDR